MLKLNSTDNPSISTFSPPSQDSNTMPINTSSESHLKSKLPFKSPLTVLTTMLNSESDFSSNNYLTSGIWIMLESEENGDINSMTSLSQSKPGSFPKPKSSLMPPSHSYEKIAVVALAG